MKLKVKYKQLRRKLFYRLTGRIKKGEYSLEMAKEYWQYAPLGLGREKTSTETLLGADDETLRSLINQSIEVRERRNLLDVKRIEHWILKGRIKRMLDFGCGVGADGVRFAKDLGIEVTFADIVESNVKLVSRYPGVFGINSRTLLIDKSEEFVFPEVYDMIFSDGVLHHIPNAFKVVENLRKYLRTNGLFIAMLYSPKLYTESGAKNLSEFRALSEGRTPRGAKVFNPYSTVYDEDEAKQLFAGFELVDSLRTYDDLYGWYVFKSSGSVGA